MLESEVKKVREQKVREAEYLYMKLRNYIKHSYPNVIEIAANSADDHQHINDIHDRLEGRSTCCRTSGLSPTKNRTKT